MDKPKLPTPPSLRWEDRYGYFHVNTEYAEELEQWTKDLIAYLRMHLEGDNR